MCQISDERRDDEVQEKDKKEKREKKTKETKNTTPSLASLNSNYRGSSSSGSESNERVSRYLVGRMFRVSYCVCFVKSLLLFLISVHLSYVSGGSGEVCSASGSQRRDHPVQGHQGQERCGEGHLPDVLPPHGEGGWKEG